MPGYVWLLSGLAIGLFVAFIIYLDKQPDTDKDFGSAVQQELEKLKQKPAETKNKPATEKKEQKFNFYTILPELEVLIPESETRPPETKNKSSITGNEEAGSAKQYILQVGSFQNVSDAEKLKANLALLGVAADIQHVTVNNQAWHRVRSGPYQSKQALYKDQNLLQKNDIHGISIELK